jgi:hypothetical protein
LRGFVVGALTDEVGIQVADPDLLSACPPPTS